MKNLNQLLMMCENMLRQVEENSWADEVKKAIKSNAEVFDENELNRIIAWFGGMRSFNDLMILECNGHLIEKEEEAYINAKLNKYRNEIYLNTLKLKKAL
jgi:hypothetical protein